LNDAEWGVLDKVVKGTPPSKQRTFVANGRGLGGAPFTIPTSAVSAVFAAAGGATSPAFAMWAGPAGSALRALTGAGTGYFSSFVHVGYIMNVGPVRYADMPKTAGSRATLVHESTHVWQGKHGLLALGRVGESLVRFPHHSHEAG
jgi:hypothetical protein